MSINLIHVLKEASREKDLEMEFIIKALEDAIATAARKFYHLDEKVYAHHDPEKDIIIAYTQKKVVEKVEDPKEEISLEEARKIDPNINIGDFIKRELDLSKLGRIAAQTAKQVLCQRIRDAERIKIYREYIQKIGDLVTGPIKRFEKGEIIVDLGKTEAKIPKDQQSKMEKWSIGERIRAVIIDVLEKGTGPQVILSRTDPRLLVRLLEVEVPEIYDGTVIIKNAVRDPGERAKVAVFSRNRDVDPVGACIGIKGARIQAITRELRGEKIDIIPWAEDIVTFAQNALAPAKINRVLVKANPDGTKSIDVVVDDNSLSLAIGKKGQNVRLASELIGVKIEVKSETDVKKEVQEVLSKIMNIQQEEEKTEETEEVEEKEGEELSQIPGIGEKTVEKLKAHGINTLEDIKKISLEELCSIPGIGKNTAIKIKSALGEEEE
ncbi:MAG: transcription termination factor NusA [Thermoanaerobaculia bacterium]